MQTQTTPKQAATPTTTVTDLKSLRLPANYGATLGVKKLLTNVLVGKPKKPQFFRTHASDDMTFPAMILENKESRESYVVIPEVAQEISELQLSRTPYALPTMKLNPDVKDIFSFQFDDFTLENYQHHPAIKAQVAV